MEAPEALAAAAAAPEAAAHSDLARLNWRGGLPVLAEGVASEFERAPAPWYGFVSRQAYLSQALGGVVARLRALTVVPRAVQHVWFSFEGVPLKWQLPVGALFDAVSRQGALPFRVTVHFAAEHPERVLACPEDAATLHRGFLHWFKQGMYLRFGSRLPFAEFRDDDHERLWESVAGGQIDEFTAVVARMAQFAPKAFPVRLLYVSLGTDGREGEGEGEGATEGSPSPPPPPPPPLLLRCRQCSVPVAEGGTTVRELAARELPGLPELREGAQRPEPRVLCQGILVPLDAGIGQLYDKLMHADLFLYLCVFR